MNKLSINDIIILKILEEKNVRHKNPCHFLDILDRARTGYSMNRDEAYISFENLENLNFIEGNGSVISFTEQMDKKFYSNRSGTMTGEYTIEQRKAARYKMLEEIYKATGGSENSFFDIYEIGEAINFPPELTETTSRYLAEESLIEFKAIGGVIGITHFGIKQYEQAAGKPEQESEYFPAPNKIQYILKIEVGLVNSQIQVGTTNSTQMMNINDKYKEILAWVQKLEETISNDNNDELIEKLSEDIEFIKNNIATGKPSNKFIGMALNTIYNIIIGITSNTIYQELCNTIPRFIP